MARPLPIASAEHDLQLATRCAAGDRAAQREFFHAQRVQVHRTLHRVLGSNAPMDDLIQETFVAAFRSLGSYRGESSLHTWIDTIATRVVYRHLARREPRPPQLQAVADLDAGGADPERRAQAREALRRLYALLDRIEPKYRIAFALHVIDGRSIRDVARATRSTSFTIKNRIWRARRLIEARAARDPLLREFLGRIGAER